MMCEEAWEAWLADSEFDPQTEMERIAFFRAWEISKKVHSGGEK